MLGEVGLGGTRKVLELKEKELKLRFSSRFLNTISIKNIVYNEDIIREILRNHDVSLIHAIPQTGVLGALWELGKVLNCGIQIQLKSLPISQEVIEVCEFLDLNPYRLESDGSRLFVTTNGDDLVNAIHEAGYTAAVIGCTTEDSARTLEHGEDIRFIDVPLPPELDKIKQ